MNQNSLRSVTLATIENYRHAANAATHAYQVGSQRLIGGLNQRIDAQVAPRINQVAPQLADALSQVRGRVTQIVSQGIDQVTSRTEKALGLGYDRAALQVGKAADYVAAIDNSVIANGLQAAARLSLPTAKVALAVSSKVAEGAQALSTAAVGKGVKPAAEAAAGKVVRRAKRTVRSVSAKSQKTVKKAVVRAKRKLA
ncbi:MAG: hypothetical protein HY021_16115 [Burkholderiales bacterium]|nr:hypothetical protein [Burkholderiales bacterium]